MLGLLEHVSAETAAGGGVFTLLAVLCVNVMRRQGYVDRQQHNVAKLAVGLADEQRKRAEAERDRAHAQLEEERLRREAAEARADHLELALAVERAGKGTNDDDRPA